MRSGTQSGQNRAEVGLTLIELAVVLAIIGILVTITAIAVRGAGNTARGTTKAIDIREVQKAVNAYHGLHPQEKWPTSRKQVGSLVVEAGALPTIPFSATSPESFVPIDWEATFSTSLQGTKTLVPHFLSRLPKHANDVTLDADGDGLREQSDPTRVWVLELGGVVRVLLNDRDY